MDRRIDARCHNGAARRVLRGRGIVRHGEEPGMARISLNPPQTLGYRLGARFSRRRYGVMLDPGAAIGHNMQVGRSYAIFEMQVDRWRQLDRELKDLAVVAAAAAIGCAWCMDFGYWEATVNHAVPAEKVRDTADWRGSKVFSE